MLFNSTEFFLFFPFVFVLYYVIPNRFQWILLLTASIFFYMYPKPVYIVIPLFIILTSYLGGQQIEKGYSQKEKRRRLIIAIVINLGVLILFKYFNFLTGTIYDIFHFIKSNSAEGLRTNVNPLFLKIIVPLGISYISFQAIGYLIEIYRGNHTAENNLGIFATYLMFFPKILSGPIERAHNFLPQLFEKHEFRYQEVVYGFKLIAWGFFKKLVIADRLALVTSQVFGNAHQYTGIPLLIAVLLFTVQLYADFSGYTDIALGVAATFGFKLMRNFDSPFIARSTTELWRRWHISLSTWFSEYIYNPIAINKRDWGRGAVVFASIITFLILGLWHGASWNFVMFGFLQGIMLSLEFLTKKIRKKIRNQIPGLINNSLGVIFTFSFFSFALIFFKTNSLNEAWYIISHMFYRGFNFSNNFGIEPWEMILIIFSVGILLLIQFAGGENNIIEKITEKPVFFRWSLYFIMVLSILFFGNFQKSTYIYFQF